ncbi:MAG: hypothetical protein HQL83_06770 [Magnetococcales bacterium]|nr:hypothetical protein [Magnetococcales bacterium]MBF0346353.1 hypothetical protein [Magnetococcales bacterium]
MSKTIMSKEHWVGLFRELGLSDDQMRRWHTLFEMRYPEGHQAFLSWLGIDSDEIKLIRDQSGR